MNIYDIKAIKRENGQDVEVPMSEFKDKVLLIVNTATGCGLTPQYEALETLYRKYKDRGLVILDFPCNQFMEQASGSDEDINSFCTARYDTTFPRFKKIDVNGSNEAPLYKFLKQAAPKREGKKSFMLSITSRVNGKSTQTSDIKWNFEKFLIARNGQVVKRFEPTTTPEQIESSVVALL